MKKFVILSFIAPALLVSCGRSWSWSDYMAIHKDGMRKLEPSRQMNAHYGEVDNFIVEFGTGTQPLQWQTVAFIDGRFELTFVQPVTVNYSKRTVTAAGAPEFHLCAVKHVIAGSGTPDEGGWGGDFDTKLEKTFFMKDWSKFVDSGFDLTSLGIPKDEIHLIPQWKEYVRAERKCLVPIK
jgi:hypothetical protein